MVSFWSAHCSSSGVLWGSEKRIWKGIWNGVLGELLDSVRRACLSGTWFQRYKKVKKNVAEPGLLHLLRSERFLEFGMRLLLSFLPSFIWSFNLINLVLTIVNEEVMVGRLTAVMRSWVLILKTLTLSKHRTLLIADCKWGALGEQGPSSFAC